MTVDSRSRVRPESDIPHRMSGFRLFLPVLFCFFFVAVNGSTDVPLERSYNAIESQVQKAEETPIEYRLSKDVIPSNYDLTLSQLNFETFTFDGTVKITLKSAIKDTKSITLHARNLTIQKASIVDGKSKDGSIDLTYTKSNDKSDLLTMHSDNAFSCDAGCELTIKYTGILNDELRGFYRSSYKNDKNTTV